MPTLGLDLGSSGLRAVLLGDHAVLASAAVALPADRRWHPAALWDSLCALLRGMDLSAVAAIAVDGTSGTLLPVAADGRPLGPLSPYHQAADPALVRAIDAAAPPATAARGATSPLARAMALSATPGLGRILHEADWIAGRLCGRFDAGDANNALKTGYDPRAGCWPAWIDPATRARLPQVLPPGAVLGRVTPAIAHALGLPAGARVAAGTTDGCASFLSTGAATPGDAVTALGSTLTLKLLSDRQVISPRHGVYSHRLSGHWLAGGASNTGGAVLAQFFTPDRLATLSRRIDPTRDSGLDYYPLPRTGERFPHSDPALPPRLLPRPDDDARFLHAMLEGIARIEARGYALLAELGAPPLRRVLSLGGGASNPVFTAIRSRLLGVPVTAAPDASAAHGAAVLARRALRG